MSFRVHFLFCVVVVSLASVTGLNEEINEIEKRAPLGFQGMRGKKADTYSENKIVDDIALHSNDIASLDMVDKRAPMGFQGMRGKKQLKDNFDLQSFYALKRAPMGFQGMRGKKDMEILNENDLPLFYKRAPVSGFMGVRGKKENEDGYEQSYELMNGIPFLDQEFNEVYDKRAPMGFQGMRGKKAPIASFFGVRGKKQPVSSSFFGMRGKKYPYEFRGKFVGVRGKKEFHDIDNVDDTNSDIINDTIINRQPDNDLNLNQLMLLLSENQERNEIPWIKRAGPNGFFGVRGKKDNEN